MSTCENVGESEHEGRECVILSPFRGSPWNHEDKNVTDPQLVVTYIDLQPINLVISF